MTLKDRPRKKNRTNDGVFFIYHAPDLDEVYFDLSSHPGWERIEGLLNNKRYTVKDTDLSYRTINHWMAEGLLDDDRQHDAGWRKLSFKDLLWVRILQELRKFGFPLEKLREVHKTLNPSSLAFETGIALCLRTPPIPVFIAVFDDGTAEVATLTSLRVTDYLVGYEHPYIRINLNTLCCEILGTDKLMPARTDAIDLMSEEHDVISALRDKQADEVKVILKDGSINRVEKTKSFKGNQHLADLLNDLNFGEMTVNVENGKPVSTKITKKTKTKK